ncbi:I78 family peptidase inhibitor [Amylibacter sp. SFDW26]|uniref:I78 family peptidase inhibitor n=1 Tax=Amylibacter sp. SFDW26 TaxID=2652722 RepID=UPI001869E47B|nr:I78 family peptidase inhibitor [Amylibacter sp. SFDW26]
MVLQNIAKVCLLTSVFFVLGACQEDQDTVQKNAVRETPAISPQCPAGDYIDLIGEKSDALKALELPKLHRIIHPNTIVTADYIETRVNFLINEAGLIDNIKCY